LPVERSQQLDSLEPPVVLRDIAAVLDEFVGQVFESVRELFKAATRLRGDSAAEIGPRMSGGSVLE
jgi:hypothetical protein